MLVRARVGLEAIEAMFEQANAAGRAAFLPYYPIGYPTYTDSLDAIAGMAAAGVDGFEIGIPFSDPLADGPTIQAAAQKALENGVTTSHCLQAVCELRQRGVTQPMLLMGYLNPLLAYGLERFASDARAAGADGLIVPDMPPDEADLLIGLCRNAGLALVFLVAPNSSDTRIALAAARATGFVYLVSVTGITGARAELPPDVPEFVARVRAQTDHKLVMGFGISTPEQAQMMNKLTDGFIVGSALVRAAERGPEGAVELARRLRAAL
ncbi:MAG: tryptophan synthase subunit alpha [Aggregatilineales bacterium]